MSAWHVPDAQLDRYASLEETADRPQLWAVEGHLDRCPQCRARLRAAMELRSPELFALSRRRTARWGRASLRSPRRPGHGGGRPGAWWRPG
jgi:hypothetical protein